MTGRHGFLAIWCDIAAEDLEDYRNWLTQEHMAERTFTPGFLTARLFEALDDPLSHFILYATESAAVLDGPDYQARLDNPTPWTRRIMPKFGPFDRALGEQVLKIGNGFGPCVCVWRLRVAGRAVDPSTLQDPFAALSGQDGLFSLRLFAVRRETTDRHSEEKTMRGGTEGDFDFLLCAETLDADAAKAAEARIGAALNNLFPGLTGFDVSCRRMIYGEAPHEGPVPSPG